MAGSGCPPCSAPEHAPRDWRSQCERERAAGGRGSKRARKGCAGRKWPRPQRWTVRGRQLRFKACRRRLSLRPSKMTPGSPPHGNGTSPSLQAEVARLETLLVLKPGIASAFEYGRGAAQGELARLRKVSWRHRQARRGRDRAVARSAPAAHRPGAFARTSEGDRTGRFARNSAGSTRRWSGGTRRTPGSNTSPRPGEGEDGAHQGDREEAVQRVPSAPPGGEDTGRHARPAPGRCPTRFSELQPCPGGVQMLGKEKLIGPARQASGGRGDAVEAAVRRGCPTARGPEAVAAPEDDDRGAAVSKTPVCSRTVRKLEQATQPWPSVQGRG